MEYSLVGKTWFLDDHLIGGSYRLTNDNIIEKYSYCRVNNLMLIGEWFDVDVLLSAFIEFIVK